MSTQHVPAWKRLGLRLKFANESSPKTAVDSDSNHHGKKRKQLTATDVVDGVQHQPQHKKARTGNGLSKTKLNGGSTKKQEIGKQVNTPDSRIRKKSVSFTADTKVDDGDSAQTIQYWVPDSPGSTPMKTSNEPSTSQPHDAIKQPKREKRPKSERNPASAQPRKPTAALEYLTHFHTQRSSWKFNKNHETWVLKHALSTELIPPQFNLALAIYLRGLKSAGARKRLAEQSREGFSAGETSVEDGDELQSNLSQAMATDSGKTGTEEDHEWIAELDRHKVVLLSFGEDLKAIRKSSDTKEKPPLRTKKNKSRTSRIELDSSSSSDSEDSSSDSETEKQGSSTGKQAPESREAESTSSSDGSDESSTETSGDSDTSSDND